MKRREFITLLGGAVACSRDFSLSDWRKLTRTCLVKRALDQKSDLAVLNFVCQL